MHSTSLRNGALCGWRHFDCCLQSMMTLSPSSLHAQTASGKTSPLQSGGALMLGGEQDCYGGCTDSGQAFYGLMDEVGVKAYSCNHRGDYCCSSQTGFSCCEAP